jgi:hypothetical protein
MAALIVGSLMVAAGLLAVTRSLSIIRHAARVWPRRIGTRDADLFLTGEFLVRYMGLLAAAAGVGLIISALV